MMNTVRLQLVLPLAMVAVALSACVTTMSREQCLATDWAGVGFQDGARGYAASRYGAHQTNCSEAQVVPDQAAYQSGRRNGLRTYCRPVNAYRAGARGDRYNGVCPSRIEPAFIYAFEAGKRIHAFNTAINRISRRMDRAERDLRGLERRIPELEARATSNRLKKRQRRQAVIELQQLSENIGVLRVEISRLAEKRARLRGKLSIVRPQYDREFGLRY